MSTSDDDTLHAKSAHELCGALLTTARNQHVCADTHPAVYLPLAQMRKMIFTTATTTVIKVATCTKFDNGVDT